MEIFDEAFNDLSYMFHSCEDEPTFRSDLLKPELFDLTIDSLSHLDDYLDMIRVDPNVEDDWNRTVLRSGAYAGEVIRQNGNPNNWHWIDYDSALSICDPNIIGEKSIVNCGVLWRGGESICFPLGKVYKFLDNGREDSIKYFTEVIIQMWKDEDAQQNVS